MVALPLLSSFSIKFIVSSIYRLDDSSRSFALVDGRTSRHLRESLEQELFSH